MRIVEQVIVEKTYDENGNVLTEVTTFLRPDEEKPGPSEEPVEPVVPTLPNIDWNEYLKKSTTPPNYYNPGTILWGTTPPSHTFTPGLTVNTLGQGYVNKDIIAQA